MAVYTSPEVTEDAFATSQLPPWLARHVRLGFDADDVAALISSIDSSQNRPSSLVNLPAELLLHVLEYVPVDHVLDWRFVCRGFRDAIDGRILYHHLQRTQLVGCLGPRHMWPMQTLTDKQYNQLRFVIANFSKVEHVEGTAGNRSDSSPIWCNTHAIFKINHQRLRTTLKGDSQGTAYVSANEYADTMWKKAQSRLELTGVEEGFGTLRWCIKLDQAVLDLDFPLEAARNSCDVAVDLVNDTVRVCWKDMMFRFLKNEAALRDLMNRVGHFTL
jgi:hypothetical protein